MYESGRKRRVDLIKAVLSEGGGRMRTKQLAAALSAKEDGEEIPYSTIHIAINAENERLEAQGKARAFRTKRDGEAWGWVSLASGPSAGTPAASIEHSILRANEKVDAELRERLRDMEWRTFESAFLVQILEKLGFQNVEITQATRDGGVDARVRYKRGVVEAKAIVSAKHWSAAKVPVSEIRNMRGIKGDEDTAIIVTSGRFSDDAKAEASPGQNQRVVYLIDGDRLIEICKEFKIGVRAAQLSPLLEIDPDALRFDGENEVDDEPDEEPAQRTRRFRDEMLGDSERGLSAEELSKMLSLELSTVRSYLSVEARRRDIGDRIRADESLRAKAIEIVLRKREQL